MLDFKKQELILCDRTNGSVADRLLLKDRLVCVQSELYGVIQRDSKHPLVEQKLLEKIRIPNSFSFPIALLFSDG